MLPVNNNVISAARCDITYNIFNLTRTINEAGKRYTIDYYPNQSRAMTTYTVNNAEQEKKIYCGREYEHNLTTNTQYNYIYVGNIPVALYVQGDSNVMYTLHTNYIGSIEKITNTAGEIVDSMSYTPFGQRRSVTDWTRNDTDTRFTDRSFTGQQHLDNFALINFNGRMYDPVLAHFLSPDPYIQAPENPLNYNRYAYCLYSPLQYVDPSGEKIDWVEGIDGKIYWDPLATNPATTKNGEKYWGKEGYGIDEETGLLVHYKSDGTKNSFIISKKGTIVAGEKISKGFNWGISLDLNFTFPIGYSIEIGYIQDANQHGSFFYSHGMTAGFEASAGINFIVVPTSNFKLSDFEGQSASLNISTPYLSGSVISDFSRGAEKDYYFNNYGGFKIGGGLGVGASLSHTKTKLLKNK